MRLLAEILRKRLCQLFLFLLGMLLFNWPLLSILTDASLERSFWAIVLCWLVLAILLILLGRSLAGRRPAAGTGSEEE